MAFKQVEVTFESHGYKCRAERDRTGYIDYYLDNMERPLESVSVPTWLKVEAREKLNA
jgi:hypothetical protein